MSCFDGVAMPLQVLEEFWGATKGAIVGLRLKHGRPPSIESAVDVDVFVSHQAVMPKCQPCCGWLSCYYGIAMRSVVVVCYLNVSLLAVVSFPVSFLQTYLDHFYIVFVL